MVLHDHKIYNLMCSSSLYYQLVATPAHDREEDYLPNAKRYEEAAVAMSERWCPTDTGDIRGDIFNVHQRTTQYV